MQSPKKSPKPPGLLRTLRLSDACLLVFLLVLMAQTAYHLLFQEMTATEIDPFGTVVRTTMAAIFGYFIGSGFLKRTAMEGEGTTRTTTPVPKTLTAIATDASQARGQIGFQIEGETSTEPTLGRVELEPDEPPEKPCPRRQAQQILIVTGVGVYALALLMIAQYSGETTVASIATLSQLRDFLSGSVGLLIGHSSNGD